MNIASTAGSPTPMPSSIAPVPDETKRAVVDPDSDSVDTPVSANATATGAGFGKLLTDRIARADADDGKTRDAESVDAPADVVAGAVAASADPVVRATHAAGDAVAADDKSNAVADASNAAAATDLAAQMALASQWAGVASHAQATRSTAAPNAQTAALDAGPRLATIRAADGSGDPAGGVTALNIDVPVSGEAMRAAEASRHDGLFDEALREHARGADIASRAQAAGSAASSADASALSPLQVTAPQSPTLQPTPAAPPMPDALRQMVGTSEWSHEVGHTMLRMAGDDLQTAALRLNPEHLGPLDIQIRVTDGVAHLAFQAAHAETRHAIESSRATLERLFAEQGLTIGNCAVGDTSSQGAGFGNGATQADLARHNGRSTSWSDAAPPLDGSEATTVTTRIQRALGLVDTFA